MMSDDLRTGTNVILKLKIPPYVSSKEDIKILREHILLKIAKNLCTLKIRIRSKQKENVYKVLKSVIGGFHTFLK